MKVKFVGKNKQEQEKYAKRLTIGKEYVVLGIEFYDKSLPQYCNIIDEYIYYRIEDNDKVVVSFPSSLFEMISDKLSSIWVGCRVSDGVFTILPKEWKREEFWNDFYNHEQNAIRDYNKAYQTLYVEELSDGEINNILEYGEKKAVEYLLKSLISSNDKRSKAISIKVATCEKWSYLWEIALNYLSNFREEVVESLFIEFLSYNEKLCPKITKIINDYFNKS